MDSIVFAIFAATSFGLFTVFHKFASPHINQIFGAILVSVTAVIVGSIILLILARDVRLVTNPKGILFVALAGIAAFCVDFFVLQAYSRGLPLSVGGPIIIGGSITVAVAIGFILGDTITVLKIFGIFFVGVGAAILASVR